LLLVLWSAVSLAGMPPEGALHLRMPAAIPLHSTAVPAEVVLRWQGDRATEGILTALDINGHPSRVALYHALAFLRYYELTRKPLWLAKGRDLVGAVCAAIEGSTGDLHTGLGTSHPCFPHFPENDGITIRDLNRCAGLLERVDR
jgi:hypothetical protein